MSIAILIVAFSFDSAGQATPVQAAPPAQDTGVVSIRHYFSIVLPREPICAGKKADFVVTPLEDAKVNYDGQTFSFDHMHMTKITILGEVKNESIGTVSPRTVISGFAWAMIHAIDETDEALRQNPGEALFTFHAKNAGETELTFMALVGGEFVGSVIPVKVVNCKYKVKMRYHRSVQGFSVLGTMSTTIQGNGEQLTGSGIMDAKSTVAAACGVTITDFLGPTDITATSSDEQLNLNFKYGSATTTTSVTCPEDTVTFSKTQDPTSFLIASAAFPSEGGTRMFAAPQGGTIIITAQPEEEGAGS